MSNRRVVYIDSMDTLKKGMIHILVWMEVRAQDFIMLLQWEFKWPWLTQNMKTFGSSDQKPQQCLVIVEGDPIGTDIASRIF